MINSNYYFAHKQHFIEKNGNLLCTNNSFLKKSLKHSSELEDHMKIRVKIGKEVNIVNDFNDTYYVVNLQQSINKDFNSLRNFYGFWDSDKKLSDIQLTQILLWAKSLLFFHKNANVFLYTRIHIIPEGLINIDKLTIIYVDKFEELFIDTPLVDY